MTRAEYSAMANLLGPQFHIAPGLHDVEGVSTGWVATHIATGLWVWSGGKYTLNECRDRLLLAVEKEQSHG